MRILKIIAVCELASIGIVVYGEGVQWRAGTGASNTAALSGSPVVENFSTAPHSVASPRPMIQPTITITTSIFVVSNSASVPVTSSRPMIQPTITITTSIFVASSSASAKPSPDPNALKACWGTGECKKLLSEFAGAYKASGKIIDPNQHDSHGHDQSRNSQDKLCKFYQYENLISVKPLEHRPMNFLTCMACFKQAGLDTNTQDSVSLDLTYKIDGFCHTNWPNLFDLLDHLLTFMLKAKAPPSIAELPAEITGQVPLLRTKFTWTSDMNRKTSAGDSPALIPVTTTSTTSRGDSTSNPTLAWLGSPLTPGTPVPTEYLAQVPFNWPYTAYGMLYRAGAIASFPLTHTNNATQTVAWLYHSLRWNPRPLYTPPTARSQTSTLYQPLLDSWVKEATWDTAQATSSLHNRQSHKTPFEPTITQKLVSSQGADTPAESRYLVK
ncbi:hypothetical protein DE146DRAFT_752821 [Phaeosphaeria sp. MPI-PUGE-AT-0046c]|nr:hypothetical protein DE146DRAFT_752821 [Phaeosphaeria sp. MPI-PUGE-AT-0046c]